MMASGLYCSNAAPQGVSRDLKRIPSRLLNHHTPASDYLFDILRPLIETILPQEYRYADRFDRFEYLMALVFADLREKSRQETSSNDFWGPIGRFVWRQRGRPEHIQRVVADEVSKYGASWAPLKAGLFDGSLARLNAVKDGFDNVLKNIRPI